MKKFFLFIVLVFSTVTIFSQQSYKLIFEKKYENLPFKIEIDNSRIYSVSSFDINKDTVLFSSFTKSGIYKFYKDKIRESNRTARAGIDFIAGVKPSKLTKLAKLNNRADLKEQPLLYRKNFLNGNSVLSDQNGILTGTNGEQVIVNAENRNKLNIKFNLTGFPNEISLQFNNNLACANLIGIDAKGDLFVLIEKYLSDIPLQVKREVYTLSKRGKVLSRLELPDIKYLYTLKDLQIDKEGNLYHLLTDKNKLKIIKWSGLTSYSASVIHYPEEYSRELHFNEIVPTNEAGGTATAGIETKASRTAALKIAETYVLHQYFCTAGNLAPQDKTAPDGDVVRTPDWLIVGENARIPYKWGGFNTITQFDNGLQNGRFAGDINTNGVSSYAVGVDCSGFVSRCWQLSYHSSTRNMPDITTQYASWDSLKPGDAIHKIGHVRLFVERNINGSLRVVESTGRGWGVSYWTYNTSDLTAYTPRYYNNMVENYNANRPVLQSIKVLPDSLIKLNWSCDTTGIFGFKVYTSGNGNNWTVVLDEQNCKTNSCEIVNAPGTKFFRVSSVKNENSNFAESNWSNILGTGNYSSTKKCLVVDGFNRSDNSTSWRGPGNPFVLKYGNALDNLSLNFTSIKNSALLDSTVLLNNYDYVIWMLGDESTVDETFSHKEQGIVKHFLESGGNLFVSGSEIGWDLDHKGDTQDKDFYHNYLKASYFADDAASGSVSGIQNTSMDGCSFHIGQTYDEDYPDVIQPAQGSDLCMKYSNGKDGGVEYAGKFGISNVEGRIIYLAFPLETTANDDEFNKVIQHSIDFFNGSITSTEKGKVIVKQYKLEQNYPNPFNPTTTIAYSIPTSLNPPFAKGGNTRGTLVTLKVYDVLGREIATLINKNQNPGSYQVNFNASSLSSGIYYYRLKVGEFTITKKMVLAK